MTPVVANIPAAAARRPSMGALHGRDAVPDRSREDIAGMARY